MSHYMTALAMQQKGIKPATKIVLYWIADHHNSETDACFPSLATLSDECEMSKRAVQAHIDTLSYAGLIERVERKRGNGSRTSNGYRLNLTKQAWQNLPPPIAESARAPMQNLPPLNLGTNNLGNITSKNMSIFDDLWKIYPKKVGKGTAKKAFAKAMTKATADQIEHSLSVFVRAWGNKDKKFMPHLATWLNGERWDDEIQEASLQDMSSDQQMQAILGSLTNDRKLLQ
jgi:biotin operon repressor